MENQQLMTMKSENLLKVGVSKLDKEQAMDFAIAFKHLFLAKNLQAMEGTLQVWEKCMLEDINEYGLLLDDFINAMSTNIRRKAFGRLDYFNILLEAITIGIKQYSNRIVCIECKSKLPQEIINCIINDYWINSNGDYINDIQSEKCKCGMSYTDIANKYFTEKYANKIKKMKRFLDENEER